MWEKIWTFLSPYLYWLPWTPYCDMSIVTVCLYLHQVSPCETSGDLGLFINYFCPVDHSASGPLNASLSRKIWKIWIIFIHSNFEIIFLSWARNHFWRRGNNLILRESLRHLRHFLLGDESVLVSENNTINQVGQQKSFYWFPRSQKYVIRWSEGGECYSLFPYLRPLQPQ